MEASGFFRFTPYGLSPLVCCLALVPLSWLVFSRGREGARGPFALVNLAVAAWNLDIFLLYSLRDPATADLVDRLSQPFIVSIPLAWVNFATAFLRSPRRRLVVGAYVIWTVPLAALSLTPLFHRGVVPMYFGFYGSAGPLYFLYILTQVATLVLVASMLAVHLRRTRDQVRRSQIGYFLLATVVMGVLSGDNFFPLYGIEKYPLGNVAVIIYLAVMALAVVRHRFMDIGMVVRKSLIYSIATFLLSAVYLALILLLEGLVRIYLLPDSLFVPLVPALAAAFMFQGIKEQVQSRLDSLFGQERRRTALLSAFAREARAAAGRGELAALFAGKMEAALAPGGLAFFTRDPDGGTWRLERGDGLAREDAEWLGRAFIPEAVGDGMEMLDLAVAGSGRASQARAAALGYRLLVPVRGRGDLCGACLLGSRPAGPYSGEDRAFIAALAGHAAAALEAREYYERWRREEKFTSLGRASATISHELRNPLNVIRGAVAYLGNRHGGGDVGRFADIIAQEVDKTSRFIEQLLRASRVPPAFPRDLDAGEWLRDFASGWRDACPEVGMELALPPGPLPARFDPMLMEQALGNLCRNGAEAMGPGGGLRLSAFRAAPAGAGEQLVIEVADRGPGIPPDKRDLVFDPFYTTKSGGSGLGLCVVDGAVRAHRGKVELDAPPGGGCVFRIRLPAAGSGPGDGAVPGGTGAPAAEAR